MVLSTATKIPQRGENIQSLLSFLLFTQEQTCMKTGVEDTNNTNLRILPLFFFSFHEYFHSEINLLQTGIKFTSCPVQKTLLQVFEQVSRAFCLNRQDLRHNYIKRQASKPTDPSHSAWRTSTMQYETEQGWTPQYSMNNKANTDVSNKRQRIRSGVMCFTHI